MSANKKIGFIYLGSQGNAGSYTKQFVDKLKTHFDVTIFVHSQYDFDHSKEVKVYKLGYPFTDSILKNSFLRKPIRYLELIFFYLTTFLILKKSGIRHIINNPVTNLRLDKYFIQLCSFTNIHFTSVVHDATSHYDRREQYRDYVFMNSDHLIFHNKHSRVTLFERLNIKAKHSFINFPWFADSSNHKLTKKKSFLFIGHDRPSKGLDLLIDAYKDLQTEYNLIISGKLTDETKSKVSKIKNSGIIVIDKYLSDEEFMKLISEASFVVLPYRHSYSNSSIHYNTYLNAKTPIICSDIPLFDQFKDEVDCIKFPRESMSLLKKALNIAESLSYDKRKQLSENGFNLMMESQKNINDQIVIYKNNIICNTI